MSPHLSGEIEPGCSKAQPQPRPGLSDAGRAWPDNRRQGRRRLAYTDVLAACPARQGPQPAGLTTSAKKWRSRPLSRVLSRTTIPLGAASPQRSSSTPGDGSSQPIVPLFGLAPSGVYRALRRCPRRRWALTPPFHPCHACLAASFGGLLSVALAVASRRPGVTWHSALWSPDFPRRSCLRRGCLGRLRHPYSDRVPAPPALVAGLAASELLGRATAVQARRRPHIKRARGGGAGPPSAAHQEIALAVRGCRCLSFSAARGAGFFPPPISAGCRGTR